MFAFKTSPVAFFIVSLFVFSVAADEFEEAVSRSHQLKLTQVNTASKGIPFFAQKTLDPIWEQSDSSPIVRIDRFSLIDQEGIKRNEDVFDKKITFVSFFFSSCAGFCPMTLRNLKQVEKKLGQKFKNVQYVAISIDPEVDNPQKLRKHSKHLNLSSSWRLFTGDKDQIYSLARDTFAAEAFKLPKSKGQFAHSEHFFVLDGERRLRGVLRGTRLDVAKKATELVSALVEDNSKKL